MLEKKKSKSYHQWTLTKEECEPEVSQISLQQNVSKNLILMIAGAR